PRVVPMCRRRFVLDVKEAEKLIDENTICVGAVLGTTFTGGIDPISEINNLLLKIKKKKGWDIPIHVDAASGGFITPFLHPKLKWDFRLKQVKSINTSGHKYGLVYPGVGWLIFKDEKDLPEELIFHVNYLGSEMPTYTLNFSKGSSMVIAQYYNLIRLGKTGYRQMMDNIMKNAKYLAGKLEASGKFQMLNKKMLTPVVAVKLKKKENYTVFDLSRKLREHGWIVPAYTLPPNAEDIAVLRIVVRENLSRDMIEMLLKDILEDCTILEKEYKGRKPATPVKHEVQHRIC
ncbi:MAG: glutamate decarboxylase, partial [Candidatus Altiarchaeales archaeon]|nr:glutamate decarboxylase [Candidatus Altiarchaeales archaeon]